MPIQRIITKYISSTYKIEYNGIDTSINPSLNKEESVVTAIEKLPWIHKFGEAGSISFPLIISFTSY